MDERLLNRVTAWGLQFQALPQRTPFNKQILAQFTEITKQEINVVQNRLDFLAAASGLLPKMSAENALAYVRADAGPNNPVILDANIEVHDQRTGAVIRHWTARVELEPGMTLQDYRDQVRKQVDASNRRYPERTAIVNRWFDWVM